MTSTVWDSENKKYVHILIHRAVCMAFHPVEGMEHLQCDHIDNIKTNNCQSNLRFVSRKFNNSRKHARRLKSENNMKTTHNEQMIRAENVSTGEVLYFRNGIDAARRLDCSTPFVYMALTGKTPLCKGHMLKWVGRDEEEAGKIMYEQERAKKLRLVQIKRAVLSEIRRRKKESWELIRKLSGLSVEERRNLKKQRTQEWNVWAKEEIGRRMAETKEV
jgi:hypothetical protein